MTYPEDIETSEPLIAAYFDVVAADAYERFSDLITDDCTFSLMPVGHTFRGREDVMRFVMTSGGARKHNSSSRIEITDWFTANDGFCVAYKHCAILKLSKARTKNRRILPALPHRKRQVQLHSGIHQSAECSGCFHDKRSCFASFRFFPATILGPAAHRPNTQVA